VRPALGAALCSLYWRIGGCWSATAADAARCVETTVGRYELDAHLACELHNLLFVLVHLDFLHIFCLVKCWQANSGAVVELPVAQDLSAIQADANGTKVLVGPVFTAQSAATLGNIALRFGTSVATLLKFNADLVGSAGVQPGQQICIMPCKK